MKIFARRVYRSLATGQLVKATKVKRDPFGQNQYDKVTLVDIVNGKSVRASSRTVQADSVRRRYYEV